MINETYIEMCREAREIQELWISKPGDRILLDSGFTDYVDVCCDEKEFTWLPRQEDLQELLINTKWMLDDWSSIIALWDWINHQDQLMLRMGLNEWWLCFVMETCFNRRWDAENREWTINQIGHGG